MKHLFRIENMNCQNCKRIILKAVSALGSVSNIKIVLAKKELSLVLVPGTTPETVIQAVAAKGYEINEIKQLSEE